MVNPHELVSCERIWLGIIAQHANHVQTGRSRCNTQPACYLNERAVCVKGIEVVVEDSLADDIQCELTEAGLHIYGLPRLCNYLQSI